MMLFVMVGSTGGVSCLLCGEVDLGRGPKQAAVEDAGEGDRRLGEIGGNDALGILDDRPRPRLVSLRVRRVSTADSPVPVSWCLYCVDIAKWVQFIPKTNLLTEMVAAMVMEPETCEDRLREGVRMEIVAVLIVAKASEEVPTRRGGPRSCR